MDQQPQDTTRRLLYDKNRHMAVLFLANEQFKYLLRVVDSGVVDIERMDHDKYARMEWREAVDPLGPWKFANTFARSTIQKTPRAARLIQEIKMDQQQAAVDEVVTPEDQQQSTIAAPQKGPTMQELVVEYKRLTGREIKSFKSRPAGIAAIEKAAKLAHVAVPEPAAPIVEQEPKTEEQPAMRSKRSKTSKRSKRATTARQQQAPKKRGNVGSGGTKGILRELFRRKGTKLLLKDIQKACKGIALSTVNTSICDLKNPKYAGAEGTMVLSREVNENGDIYYKRVE